MKKDLEMLNALAQGPLLFIAKSDAEAIVRLMHEYDVAMDQKCYDTAKRKIEEVMAIMERIKSKCGHA